MSPIPHLLGMIHLPALPGSPGFAGSMTQVLDAALSDASTLTEAGFPALIVENFGDTPFFADTVPPETVAAMSVAVDAVMAESGLPVGVNVLRNDALASVAIAAVTGASFVRVNVLTGIMYTDQGLIEGRAAQVARKRAAIAPDVEIWADVMVKHAVAPPGLDIRHAGRDTVERGRADAVIVSGPGTGAEPCLDHARALRVALPKEVRVVIGSGAGTANMATLAEVADSVIVGSAAKFDGDARNRVDPVRAGRLVEAATDCGLL